MNEKRFELDGTGIFDNKTNRFFYKTFDNEEVVDLLNELSEENEQLKEKLQEEDFCRLFDKLNEQQNIISKLESDLQKIPPKIRELWIGED